MGKNGEKIVEVGIDNITREIKSMDKQLTNMA
jgi:hypothetical protein